MGGNFAQYGIGVVEYAVILESENGEAVRSHDCIANRITRAPSGEIV
ncbi:MAG TPA: hypothetical protein VL137_00765 [Polyangiaceae bacterium]|nr:hypothetical protein [Polyangiaceae bacterium]